MPNKNSGHQGSGACPQWALHLWSPVLSVELNAVGDSPRKDTWELVLYFFWTFPHASFLIVNFMYWFYREEGKETGGDRKRNIDLLFHLLMHSLVASCMCLDWGSNLQPWHVRRTLYLSYSLRALLILNYHLSLVSCNQVSSSFSEPCESLGTLVWNKCTSLNWQKNTF